MSSSSNSSRTKILALASVTALSVIGYLLYNYYTSSPPVSKPLVNPSKPSGNDLKKVDAEDVESEEEDDEEEDDEEDEEDENEADDEPIPELDGGEEELSVEETLEKALAAAAEQQKKKQEEENKAKYDSAVSMAKKLFSGNEFVKAAAKYKEAIELASSIPSAQKDLVVLYNNSSAMYEKAKMYQDAILDSNIVLSMDPKHTKARIRRARVYEAQNLKLDAFNDLVCTMMIEQIMAHASGQQPSYNQQLNKDIERLNRELAVIESTKVLDKLMSCDPSDKPFEMPSKTLCINYFESFPSYYLMKEKLEKSEREDLKAAHLRTAAEAESNASLESCTDALIALLDFVHYDLINARMNKAFETLNSATSMTLFDKLNELVSREEGKDLEARKLLADHLDLRAQQLNLHSNLNTALSLYQQAVDLSPETSFETKLRIAQIYIDVGKDAEATDMYDKIISSLSQKETGGKQQCDLAWAYAHRFNICTVKNQFGLYNLETLNGCLSDLKKGLQSLTAAEALGYTSEDVKGCKFVILLKQQQGISQIKPSVTSFDPMHPTVTSEEDKATLADIVVQAKALYPTHPMLLLLEIDSQPQDPATLRRSIAAVDAVLEKADADNTYPLMIKGTILSQKIFQATDEYSYHAAVSETEKCFQDVIEHDPTNINAYISLVQVKSMKPGHELADSVKLLENALKYARNKDELVDATTQLIICRAQAKAIEDIKQF